MQRQRQNVQAASEPSLQTQKSEVGTLEITLTAMEWKYDHSEPGDLNIILETT
ncbi:hypothetical protein ACT7C6_02820 [Bacillus paranthracis]